MTAVEDAALAQIVRAEAGLIVASLHRRTGDFDVAEEAVQEAVVAALRSWRSDGVPPNPGGWLALTARRRAIDLLRRRAREQRLVEGNSMSRAARPTLSTRGERRRRPADRTSGCRCCSAAVIRR